MKNSNDTSRDRPSDLPICNTAPYPLCYRGPHCNAVPKQNAQLYALASKITVILLEDVSYISAEATDII